VKKRKQRKIEKKRKAERQRRRQQPQPLAYRGNKFKNNRFLPLIFSTETGIHESFVMSDRQLTDHDVRAALESLIQELRGGAAAIVPQPRPGDALGGTGLIAANVRRHWEEFSKRDRLPGREDLVGVLRTILGSIDVWGNISPTSRGYLRYLEGFMGKLGVHCQAVSSDVFDAPEQGDCVPEEFFDDEEESELLLAGRAWIEQRNADAALVFHALAEEMISAGEAAEVAETCQQLMGETSDRSASDELARISLHAQQELPAPTSRLGRFFGRLIGR
jgi:hypothetical protein